MFRKKSKDFRYKAGDNAAFFVTIKPWGQAMIEVTFSVVVLVGLILGMIKVYSWVSRDLSSRRGAHEQILVTSVNSTLPDDTYRQIRPHFYEGTPIDAATINSEIFGANRL